MCGMVELGSLERVTGNIFCQDPGVPRSDFRSVPSLQHKVCPCECCDTDTPDAALEKVKTEVYPGSSLHSLIRS